MLSKVFVHSPTKQWLECTYSVVQEEILESLHRMKLSDSTKLNARLALRQRADLLVANISTNRISLPQGQSYTEGKYNNGS